MTPLSEQDVARLKAAAEQANPLHVTTTERPTPYAAQLRSIAQWVAGMSTPLGNRPLCEQFAKELREAATTYERLQTENALLKRTVTMLAKP